jgi:uncharacterized protein YegP (UPF0339 family)
MSGHRPFAELYAAFSQDRRRRIDAEVASALDEMERAQETAKFVIYRAADGMFRWRLVAANREILAESADSHRTRSECLKSIDQLRAASSTLAVEEMA